MLLSSSLSIDQRSVGSLSVHYGWVNVIVASMAMTATLPGRTHGLGLITESLMADVGLGAIAFARINFIAAILGASFCLPIGWLIDRVGVRHVLTAVTAALALSVLAMSHCATWLPLTACLILVRGFGQSALSLVAIAAIAKWFDRRLGIAMGVFAVLLTFGFIASVLGMGQWIDTIGWRGAWQRLGWILLAFAPLAWLLVRDWPGTATAAAIEPVSPLVDRDEVSAPLSSDAISSNARSSGARFNQTQAAHLQEAHAPRARLQSPDRLSSTDSATQVLRVPAFWMLVLGSSLFNFVWSSVTLFNESILGERGIAPEQAVEGMAILTGTGLLANLACGGLATRQRIMPLLGVGLLLMAGGMGCFAMVDGIRGARLYAAAIGLSGGVITVVFFAAWRHLFGQSQLGRIQGFAQLATVIASALGPVVLAEAFARLPSYQQLFGIQAVVVTMVAIGAFFVPAPLAAVSNEIQPGSDSNRGPRRTPTTGA